MQWNTSSFDGVELSELQGIKVKQTEREKCRDTGGTQTLRLQVKSTSLNHETTSAPPMLQLVVLILTLGWLKHLISLTDQSSREMSLQFRQYLLFGFVDSVRMLSKN